LAANSSYAKLTSMFKNLIERFWPAILITLVIFIFFNRLFIPQLSTFVTPDYGRTDVIHLGLAQKYVFSNHLKNLSIPLWVYDNGQGYPFNIEMIDMFYIPNLVIFGLLPFKFAVPFSYLFTFLVASFSMYILLRSLNFSKKAAVFGAITFTFSSALILRIQHPHIANAISIFPLAIKFFLDLQKNFSFRSLFFFSLFSSQVLISFPQIGVYSILLFFIQGFINAIITKKKNFKKYLLHFFLGLFLIFLLSAIYFLPAISGTGLSGREKGMQVSKILNTYPYRPENLLSFVNPFILGKPSDGTYKYKSLEEINNKGIFWENTAYFGLLPFILSILGIIYITYKRDNKVVITIAILALITMLLALGKNAPFHFVYSFPPLNYFRVPARFILFTQIFLIILSSYLLDKILNKVKNKVSLILSLIFYLVLIADLFTKWWNYNPIGTVDEWIKKPEILSPIDSTMQEGYQFFTIGSTENWNEIFVNYGWERNLDSFKFFLNSIEPNTNVFYNISHLGSYQNLSTRRQNLQQLLIKDGILKKESEIEINDASKKALNTFGVKFLVTTKPINSSDFSQIKKISNEKYSFYLYENKQAKEKFQLYYDYFPITHLRDYLEAFKSHDPDNVVFIEKELGLPKLGQGVDGKVSVISFKESRVRLLVESTEDAILLFNNTYFPGWNVKIDDQEDEIVKANINSQAVIVPSGKHKVEFYYSPKLFYFGALITILTIILSSLYIWKSKLIKVLTLRIVK